MKGLGYVLLVFLGLGCWIVWQIVRRASAGAQAVINPERYAVEKVEQMQQDMRVGEMLLARERGPADTLSDPTTDRWNALVKYDEEVSAAAEQLRKYGHPWIDELRRAYLALNEDKKYLPNIVKRLREEAEQEAEAEARRRTDEEESRRQAEAEARRQAEQERRRREAELRRLAEAQAEADRKAAEARAVAERQAEGRSKAEFVILLVCGIAGLIVAWLFTVVTTNGG